MGGNHKNLKDWILLWDLAKTRFSQITFFYPPFTWWCPSVGQTVRSVCPLVLLLFCLVWPHLERQLSITARRERKISPKNMGLQVLEDPKEVDTLFMDQKHINLQWMQNILTLCLATFLKKCKWKFLLPIANVPESLITICTGGE